MRLLGLDPGLRSTGWGVIDIDGNSLSHVSDGSVKPDVGAALSDRLAELYDGLRQVIETFHPDRAAVEETFVSRNASSTMKLGQARGVVLLAPALAGLPVAEYPANLIKKSVVGAGHAAKQQVSAMVRMLLPRCEIATSDAADALAVAICHAHHMATERRWDGAAPVDQRRAAR